MSNLEHIYQQEGRKTKSVKKFFIYPNKSHKAKELICDDDSNGMMQAKKIEQIKDEFTFEARNFIIYKFGVNLSKNDIINFNEDVKMERTYKDFVKYYKMARNENNFAKTDMYLTSMESKYKKGRLKINNLISSYNKNK